MANLTKATLLPTGQILSYGYMVNGLIRNPFGNSTTGIFNVAPSFNIQAENLTPDAFYKVLMYRTFITDQGHDNIEYPMQFADFDRITGNYEVTLQADSGGYLTGLLHPPDSTSIFNALGRYNDFYNPSTDSWVDVNGDSDPDEYMKQVSDTVGGRFMIDTPYGTKDVIGRNRDVTYTLLLRQSNNAYVATTNVTCVFTLLVDVDQSGFAGKMDVGELVVPADFADPNSTYYPSSISIESSKVTIPYSNTSDREVIMCDSRMNASDVDLVSLREMVVPYTSDEFIVTTQGGSLIPISSTTDNGDGTTNITTSSDIAGEVFVGIPYSMEYHLGNIVFKKPGGGGKYINTNRAIKDNLQTMTIAYSDSASFSVEISRPKREDRIVEFTSNTVGYSSIGEADLDTGEFRFHVRGKTRDTSITVTDDSVFPVHLQHIEIERNVISRSR